MSKTTWKSRVRCGYWLIISVATFSNVVLALPSSSSCFLELMAWEMDWPCIQQSSIEKGHAETTLLSYKIVSFKSNDRLIINVTLNGQWMQSWWASDEVIWYWLKQLTVIVKVKCINLQNYALYPPRHDFAQKHQLLQIPYHPPTDESDVILNMKLMHMSQPPFLSYIATLSI